MNLFSNLIGSMGITPRLGLNMVRGQIEKQLGFNVHKYELHFNAIEEKISFVVPYKEEQRKYPYEDNVGLGSIIKKMAEKEVQTGDKIDYLIIKYGDAIEANIYYTDTVGNKQYIVTNF